MKLLAEKISIKTSDHTPLFALLAAAGCLLVILLLLKLIRKNRKTDHENKHRQDD